MHGRHIRNDTAASEILGVLLIVIIITIIASFTALFVYGFLESAGKPRLVDFTIRRINPETIEIQNNGGPSLGDLKSSDYFKVKINDQNQAPSGGGLTNAVGSYARYAAATGSHVVIIGSFKDDKDYILHDQTI